MTVHQKTAIASVLILFGMAILALSFSTRQGPVDLAADVNRDGYVDFQADAAGEDQWTDRRGAIFLNNNDRDAGRGEPDNADEAVNGSNDLKDMAVLILQQMPDLPAGSRVVVSVDEASRDRVRLFQRSGPREYIVVGPAYPAPLEPDWVRAYDLELRIEATTYADSEWNGECLVTVALETDQGVEAEDSVRLRVAPWIMQSNLHQGTELYVRVTPGRNDLFIEQLQEAVPAARAILSLIPEEDPYTRGGVWCQDAMEIGYSEMPGQRISVVFRANRNRGLDEYARQELLGPDYGWFTHGEYRPHLSEGRSGNRWLDWYGNLEVSPPVPGYPMGRIYYGANGDESLNPEIVAMLDAQGVQGPAVRLDTGWFMIKHVDEMVCFVPTGRSGLPHKVLVPNTVAMIELMDDWIEQGLGDLPLLGPYREDATVASLRGDEALIAHNRALQTDRIDPNIETLKREMSLKDGDFIHIPALVSERGSSVFPNMVNSVVLNGYFLVSDPCGPVVDGRDLVQEHVRGLLQGIPLEIHFLDDRRYHSGGGNVHCATNVRRAGFELPWWEIAVGY
jgi:protein-arginine deiminase